MEANEGAPTVCCAKILLSAERNQTLISKPVDLYFKFQLTETADGFERFGAALIRDGICIITGTPDRDVHDEIGEKCGIYLSPTHYGWVAVSSNAERIKPVVKEFHCLDGGRGK